MEESSEVLGVRGFEGWFRRCGEVSACKVVKLNLFDDGERYLGLSGGEPNPWTSTDQSPVSVRADASVRGKFSDLTTLFRAVARGGV